jgi:hypothetical protein
MQFHYFNTVYFKKNVNREKVFPLTSYKHSPENSAPAKTFLKVTKENYIIEMFWLESVKFDSKHCSRLQIYQTPKLYQIYKYPQQILSTITKSQFENFFYPHSPLNWYSFFRDKTCSYK